MWKQINSNINMCSVYNLENPIYGIEALQELFPLGVADSMNFCLFSTSGVHGSYTTIEDIEQNLKNPIEESNELTFLVIHPRTVVLRYGRCLIEDEDDIKFLKKLRASSLEHMSMIGFSRHEV